MYLRDRASAHGEIGCRKLSDIALMVNRLAISRSRQCSTTGVTKTVLCAILSVGWRIYMYKRVAHVVGFLLHTYDAI